MGNGRFTDSQSSTVPEQAEAEASVPELRCGHGIDSTTFYTWRSKSA